MIRSLKNQAISECLVKIINDMYTDLKARIIRDVTDPYFNIERGVRQDDPLSPILFNCQLEVFRTLNWDSKWIKINGEYLNNLRFAEDIILFLDDQNQLENLAEELRLAGNEAEFEINITKTNFISNDCTTSDIIGKENIARLEDTTYLNQTVRVNDRMTKELNRHITITCNKYWNLKHIFEGQYSNKLKSQIFNSNMVTSLTYGSQTWALTNKHENLLKYYNILEL